MVEINGLGPMAAPVRSRARATAAGGFAVDESGQAAPAAAAPQAMSLAGLLALQAEGEGEIQDREARGRGRDLLAELDALRHALLKGEPGLAPLRRLADLAADLPVAADPRLRAALEQIALRAQVELARHGLG